MHVTNRRQHGLHNRLLFLAVGLITFGGWPDAFGFDLRFDRWTVIYYCQEPLSALLGCHPVDLYSKMKESLVGAYRA